MPSTHTRSPSSSLISSVISTLPTAQLYALFPSASSTPQAVFLDEDDEGKVAESSRAHAVVKDIRRVELRVGGMTVGLRFMVGVSND